MFQKNLLLKLLVKGKHHEIRYRIRIGFDCGNRWLFGRGPNVGQRYRTRQDPKSRIGQVILANQNTLYS